MQSPPRADEPWVAGARSAETPNTSTIASRPSGPTRRRSDQWPEPRAARERSCTRPTPGSVPRPCGSSRTGGVGWPIRSHCWASGSPTRIRACGSRPSGPWPSSRACGRPSWPCRALDRPIDTFLEYGLWLTATQLAPQWLPEVQAGRFDFGGRPDRLVFALEAVNSPACVKPLLALLEAGKVPGAQDESVQTLIATLGEPDDLAAVLDLVLSDQSLPGPRRAALLDTLARAAERRKVVPAGDLSRIVPLLASRDDAMRAAALRAVGAWNVPALQDRLAELASARGDLAGPSASRPSRHSPAWARPRGGGRSNPSPKAGRPPRSRRWPWRPSSRSIRRPPRGGSSPGSAGSRPIGPATPPIVLARVLERTGSPALLASALEKWPTSLGRPTWPSSASARSGPRAATSPP